jgi:tetratricopeptide (TPR) repeat protein
MKNYQRCFLLLAVAASLCALALRVQMQTRTKPAQKSFETELAAREAAYRANNLGVALLEQYRYREGAEAFERALRLNPNLRLARINLSIALYNLPDLTGAEREARRALALAPDAPQPHYILGLIAKTQNRTDDALAAFNSVRRIDPLDVGANVNRGQLFVQQRKYALAVAAFRDALAAEPYNMTALYNLGLALTRTGQRTEGQQMIARFQQLQRSGAGTTIGTNYLEQGRYSEAIASTGAEPELVDRKLPSVVFADATASMLPEVNVDGGDVPSRRAPAASIGTTEQDASRRREKRDLSMLGGGITLFDYDSDGDLDLLDAAPARLRLWRNDGGKFTDVSVSSGLQRMTNDVYLGALAGDYDNDGRTDLFILSYSGGCLLYHNDGEGRFSDATRAAGVPRMPEYLHMPFSAAFVDADHDGDLDILIAGPSNLLLRNNGEGKFTDITATAQVQERISTAMAVVPTDFDNRRDVDLFILHLHDAPTLFRNMRDGTFRNVAVDAGLMQKGDYTCVAAGDFNKDAYTDFFLGRKEQAGLFALSDGRGRFILRAAPAGTAFARAAQFLDYDSDGLLDLVLVTRAGLRLWRNVGGEWADVSERVVPRELLSFNSSADENALRAVLASGDVDGDGDVDLLLRGPSEELRVVRNEGGNRNESLRVRLSGRVSNRSGIGAKVEVRSGSLVQKLETYSASPSPAPADIVFGLGQRERVDAVRVLWPAGIVQAETEIPSSNEAGAQPPRAALAPLVLPILELDRKPSSCPFLYTWNGERFEFITDFMGGGEMGYRVGPSGSYNTPDPDEYVRIPGDKLKERDGRYELRIMNELEEVLFVDRLQLVSVAHPRNVEVYPNEGLLNAPPPFKLYATRDARPPLAATDEHGHDVLPRILHLDRQYPDDFTLDRLRGYSREHRLTLKLDTENNKHAPKARTLLLLTGWTDYAFSSDNVAASHAGKHLQPPALQIKDARGRWHTVVDNIGIPIGRPQTITLDLTGKFPTRNPEVRIVTNMRIYWDQILVDTSGERAPLQLTRLDPLRADLHWRGYSAAISPDGREPFAYDYERISHLSTWKVMPGRYTREGDVRALLLKTDDIFVIARTGDEISLSFDARALPQLPAGWTRTFLLYADGYSKEMDINSATPDTIGPLPFHGMTRYPYRAPEAYPLTDERRAYIERYNTRTVAAPIPVLLTSEK